MTHGKTYNKSPRKINHKATKSKTNTGTIALDNEAKPDNEEITVKWTEVCYWLSHIHTHFCIFESRHDNKYAFGTYSRHDHKYAFGTYSRHDNKYAFGTYSRHDNKYTFGTYSRHDNKYAFGTYSSHDNKYAFGTYSRHDNKYAFGTYSRHDNKYAFGTYSNMRFLDPPAKPHDSLMLISVYIYITSNTHYYVRRQQRP